MDQVQKPNAAPSAPEGARVLEWPTQQVLPIPRCITGGSMS
jgi:hypothetical protein